ncbi:MAG TPA: OB-fold nucleic acid binding domain-containing protein [Syntrophales bacterium]|nr:OB-fold nucleic acid binding domain-containing protein [Syntrophales bacterium]HPC33881.1 OB-fold nucleic acid binding domain-containing protein [Syntrophales bacterium]HQG35166.1 OB-fold nucleic acid binding domain-containing protein [Syntrophales bacterium]HQI36753.1 OB-fold nucleic acid binding domain-containing protein [Syntrophales bacterium]HQJ31219.1 OB-fold nucleic acid binding domain-containing protein [Syntrophales bacterium]
MSLPAWIAFAVCAVAVVIHYVTVRDDRFLIFAIPGLIALLVIPMTLAWMSRRTLTRAAAEHMRSAKPFKIGKITLANTGQAVRITGEVRKVSFKWLNRPHFQVQDGTGSIRVIMFTAPAEDIKPGDRVDVLGVGIKNIFDRRTAAISAVSITKA